MELSSRFGHFRAVDPELLGQLAWLAPIEEYRAGITHRFQTGVEGLDDIAAVDRWGRAQSVPPALSSLRRRYWASSLQGEISKYRRDGFTERSSLKRVAGI
jgi:hypothetical protein